MTPRPYSFDGRDWTSSGARRALLNAASALDRVGTMRTRDAARLIRGRWQSVAARPSLADEVMDDAREARSIERLRQQARDARSRAQRSAANATRDGDNSPMGREWRGMSREANRSARLYAGEAAARAFELGRRKA